MKKRRKANVQALRIEKKETNKEKGQKRSEDKKVKPVSHPLLSLTRLPSSTFIDDDLGAFVVFCLLYKQGVHTPYIFEGLTSGQQEKKSNLRP